MMHNTSKRVKKAIEVMLIAHNGQLRDDGVDYTTHPIEVACILTRHGVQDDEPLMVALMHDVLEDSKKYSYMDLRGLFGKEIAAGVFLLTRLPGENKDEYYLRMAKSDSRFKVVKLADRLHNIKDMKGWNFRRRKSYAKDTMKLLRAVPRGTNPLLWDKIDLEAKEILKENGFIGE